MQLLRDGRSRLEVQDKRAINDTCVGIFEKLLPHVSEFQPTDQQILVLELSQLGIVFISQEWHSFCPPVPVPLLNGLLDGLLMRLQKLRGDQVGVLLISLQRLQLSDRDAYTKILDEVENQLRAPGANSWYRKPENMGKLVRGVATVFLVRYFPALPCSPHCRICSAVCVYLHGLLRCTLPSQCAQVERACMDTNNSAHIHDCTGVICFEYWALSRWINNANSTNC